MGGEMNVRLLRKVKAHILEEPRRFAMGTWLKKYIPGTLIDEPDSETLEMRRVPACGTVGCIAGWTVDLTGGKSSRASFDGAARRRLGISPTKSTRLFYTYSWPLKFSERYQNAKTKLARAKIAAERIEHFISTKGAE
jgi:hypothetical protein